MTNKPTVTLELEMEVEGNDRHGYGFRTENHGSIHNKDCYGNQRLIWIPVKFVEDHGDGTFTIPEWIAIDRGLV